MKPENTPKSMVTVRLSGTVAMLDLTGDLTPSAREEVEAAYTRVNTAGVKKLVLTFRRDAYINSGGIAIIINIAIAGAKNDQKIRIVQPSEHFQKIFTMVGLRQYVEIFGTEADALAGF